MTLRTDELLESTLDRFEAELSLPSDGGVIPRSIAAERDGLDPRVTVDAELQTLDRNNKRDERTATLSVWVDGTQSFVDSNGTLELRRIQDDAVDLLAEHLSGQYAANLQSFASPTHNDTINRYQGAVTFAVERTGDLHTTHTNED